MQQQPTNEAVDKVVGDIQKDFKIVGTHRVHSWYAWAIVGIVFGMALGIVYVANRSVQVQESDAAKMPASTFSLKSNSAGELPKDVVTLINKHEKEYGAIGRVTIQPVSLSSGGSASDQFLILGEGETFLVNNSSKWLTVGAEIARALQGSNPVEIKLGATSANPKMTKGYLLIGQNAKAFINIINSMVPLNGGTVSVANGISRQCECGRIMSVTVTKKGADGTVEYASNLNRGEDDTKPFDFEPHDTGASGTAIRLSKSSKSVCTSETDCEATCKTFKPSDVTLEDLKGKMKNADAKKAADAMAKDLTITPEGTPKPTENNGKCQEAVPINQ